jgi:O-antigen ligase
MVATGLIGLLIAFLTYMILCKKNQTTYWKLFIISIALFFSIVVLQANYIKIFGTFLSFFGKDLTFSFRIYIWEAALKLIPKKIILGYGISDFIVPIFGGGIAHPAHNEILNVMLKSGVLGLICLILTFFIVIRVNCNESLLSKEYISILFALSIMMITEILSSQTGFYFIISLGYCLGSGVVKSNDKELYKV